MNFKGYSLKKHNKPITCVKFNRDGDLLFTASRDLSDNNLLLWNPANGELVGNYSGHEGVVSDLDINFNSTMLLSAGVDKKVKFWQIDSGEEVLSLEHESMMRSCKWSASEREFLCVQMEMTTHKSCIYVYAIHNDLRTKLDPTQQTKKARLVIKDDSIEGNFQKAFWADLDQKIISGGEDGRLRKWSAADGKQVASSKISDQPILNIATAYGGKMMVVCSSDGTATVVLADTFTVLKRFETDRPIHAAALSPKYPLLLLAGGQNKRDVTTTGSGEGKLEVLYYNFVTEKVVGETRNHFGPVYQIAIAPDGKCMASGGEDSFIKLHYYDEEFEAICEQFKVEDE